MLFASICYMFVLKFIYCFDHLFYNVSPHLHHLFATYFGMFHFRFVHFIIFCWGGGEPSPTRIILEDSYGFRIFTFSKTTICFVRAIPKTISHRCSFIFITFTVSILASICSSICDGKWLLNGTHLCGVIAPPLQATV